MPVGNFVSPEIIMGYKSPDFSALNPSQMMNNVLAYKQAKATQQANELALATAKQQAADKALMQEAYNQPDSVNYLRGLGRVDLANQFVSAQREESAAQLESATKQLNYKNAVAKADKEKTDTALQNVRDMFLGVMQRHPDLNTQDALNDYLKISQMAHNDPNLGPILSSTGAHHAATVLQGQTALEEGNLPDLIRNSAFSADEIRKNISSGLYEPKPMEIDLGGTKQVVDMNPRSPTYKQPIKEYTKTPTPGQEYTHEINLDRLAKSGVSQVQYPLVAKAIAEGRAPPIVNSRTAALYEQVFQINPDADLASSYARSKLLSNAVFQNRGLAAQALPEQLNLVAEAGKKLNFSPKLKLAADIQAFYKSHTQDPDLTDYMTKRNDVIQSLAFVMRNTGMTEGAVELEKQVATPTMSPEMLDRWMKAQLEILQPRLKQFQAMSPLPSVNTPPPPADEKDNVSDPLNIRKKK